MKTRQLPDGTLQCIIEEPSRASLQIISSTLEALRQNNIPPEMALATMAEAAIRFSIIISRILGLKPEDAIQDLTTSTASTELIQSNAN